MRSAKRIFSVVSSALLTAALLLPSAVHADSNSAFQTLVSQYPAEYQTLHDAGISDDKLKSFLQKLLTKLRNDSRLQAGVNFDKVLISDAIAVSGTDSVFQEKLMGLFTPQELLDAAKGIVPPELIPVRDIMLGELQDTGGGAGGDVPGTDPANGLYTTQKGSNGATVIAFNDEAVLKAWQDGGQKQALQVKLADPKVPYELHLSSALLSKGKELMQTLTVVAGQTSIVLPFPQLSEQATTLLVQPVGTDEVTRAAGNAHLQVVGQPASVTLLVPNQAETDHLLSGNTYAQTRIILPKGVDLQSLGAYLVDQKRDQSVPVPFSVETQADGTSVAVVHHLSAGKFFLASRSAHFTDIGSHWSKASVDQLVARGVLSGYDDGTFRPEQSITRAEFAAMLTRALGILPQGNRTFSDVDLSKWYSAAVAAASSAKLIQGDEQGHFRPDALVSRQEAAVMLSNAVDFLNARLTAQTELTFNNLPITDKSSVPQWGQQAVAKVVSKQLMRGDDKQAFHPEAVTTRAQAAVMLHNLLDLSDLASK
ncbi:MAG: S-layer homology domain-containing protein [Tumebacillaceae bacterium]